MLPIREVKAKNARTKRYLDNKAPQIVENTRTTLFLKYTSTSDILNLVLADLGSLKKPYAVKFNKRNPVHPVRRSILARILRRKKRCQSARFRKPFEETSTLLNPCAVIRFQSAGYAGVARRRG